MFAAIAAFMVCVMGFTGGCQPRLSGSLSCSTQYRTSVLFASP